MVRTQAALSMDAIGSLVTSVVPERIGTDFPGDRCRSLQCLRATSHRVPLRLCGRVFKCFPRQVLSSLVDSHHRRTVSELQVMFSWPLGCWAVMRLSRSMCLLTLVSLVLAATLVGQVIAAPLKNKKQAHRQHTMTTSPRRSQQGGSDYHEQLLDKVPFGSRQWWDIYQRSRPGGG